jgi:hypothetical protein
VLLFEGEEEEVLGINELKLRGRRLSTLHSSKLETQARIRVSCVCPTMTETACQNAEDALNL